LNTSFTTYYDLVSITTEAFSLIPISDVYLIQLTWF